MSNPPKPSRLRILQGNPGKRPLPVGEPQPQPGRNLRCPAWIHKYGKQKWRELAPKLLRLGLLTEVDGEAFALACQAWADWRLAVETLAREGSTIKVGGWVLESGEVQGHQLQPHPAVSMQRAAWDRWRKASALFGLSPSDRTRVRGAPTAEAPDALTELLNRATGVEN
jgi:P27 family predicted phage terminase small subunit